MSFGCSSCPAAGAGTIVNSACDAAHPASGWRIRGGCVVRKPADQMDHFGDLRVSGYEVRERVQGCSTCKQWKSSNQR